MGAADSEKAQRKIDESDGICSESDYGGCRGRFCSSDRGHIIRDVLRGLLVLTVIAVVVAVIFLLCFFLIKDKQDDELIDELVREFSGEDENIHQPPEFSISSKDIPDNTIYSSGAPDRGDIPIDNRRFKDQYNFGHDDPQIVEPGEEVDRHDVFVSDYRPREEVLNNPFPEAAPSDFTAEDEAFLSFDYSVPVRIEEMPLKEQNIEDFELVVNAERELAESLPKELPPGGDFDFANFPEVVASSGSGCNQLKLPMCVNSMPWGVTSFPNWVNNTNMQHLQDSLQYFKDVIIDSKCSTRSLEYTCAILEPPCGPDENPLPPCRKFCEDISSTCQEFLIPDDKHNGVFDCHIFPNSDDPNVCVEVRKASADPLPTDRITNKNERKNSRIGTDNLNKPKSLSTNTRDETVEIQNIGSKGLKFPKNPEILTEDAHTDVALIQDTKDEDVPTEDYVYDEEEPLICDLTLFLCEDGSDCFGHDNVCDGVQQCLDNSDEFNCTESIDHTAANPSTLSRRPSLSEMLSSSALVAVPELTETVTTMPEESNTIRTQDNLPSTKNKRKHIDQFSVPSKNSFSSLTESPSINGRDSSKLSLAELLSATSLTPVRKTTGIPLAKGPETKEGNIPKLRSEREPAQFPPTPARSLSRLLSSSFSDFAPHPSRH